MGPVPKKIILWDWSQKTQILKLIIALVNYYLINVPGGRIQEKEEDGILELGCVLCGAGLSELMLW